ncbi:MAG: 3'-5' exonuclease [Spirulinaceae cyanobacterium SM2_1_0]|nr:3'-5' exonuclease [Spirulinaceae cyanobacterium SM2_1_0]
MSAKLLIVDTETTGIDPDRDRVIEVAAILYSVETRSSLYQMSALLPARENRAVRINRIAPAALQQLSPQLEQQSLELLQGLAREADYAVAHNAEFDQQWFGLGKLPLLRDRTGEPLPWLCTMTDFTWPLASKSNESLINLALSHGIGVSSAHRALTDCQLIAALFDRIPDLSGLLEQALQPRYWFQASVSYQERHLAKEAGFRWYAERRAWLAKLTVADTQALPFAVTQIDD